MAAFNEALQLGADAIEFDLRLTADGELVAVHDRMLDGALVADTAQAALRAPTLDEVLAGVPDARLWIEMKEPTPPGERRLLELLDRHDARERATVQSFSAACLERLAPEGLRLALLFEHEVPSLDGAGHLAAIGPEWKLVDERLVADAHARGLTVHAWTVNEEEEMRRLTALGVDGLITDVPDRALAIARQAPHADT
jgi:glycerophosphoryl diester phosphodiesterase